MVILHVAFLFPAFTVITAFPFLAFAVTTPFEVTVATFSLLDFHVTFVFEDFGESFAFNLSFFPFFNTYCE